MSKPTPGCDTTSATILDILRNQAATDPEHLCFWDEDSVGRFAGRSHAEVWRAVQDLAKALRGVGVGPGDRVGLLMRPSSAWEIADKAVLYVGAISVGLDVHSSPAELSEVLEQARPKALFAEDRALLERVPEAPRSVLSQRIVLRGEPGPAAVSFWPFLASRCADADPGPSARPEDVAILIFTSGTTGRPKGIPLRHEQLIMPIRAMGDVFSRQLRGHNRTLAWVPLNNATGRLMGTVNFGLGVSQYFVRDPHSLFDKVEAVQPTYLVLMPRLLEKLHSRVLARLRSSPRRTRIPVEWALRLRRACHQAARRDGGLLTRFARGPLQAFIDAVTDRLVVSKLRRAIWGDAIKFIISGSAPVDPRILELFDSMGVPTCEVYGMSELATLATMNRPGDQHYGSVGTPLPGVEMKLAADGEVLLRTDASTSAYWPTDASEGLVDRDGYLRTGDLGELRRGRLFLRGRKKEIIKTSTGQRISPAAIEGVYGDIPGLDSMVVVGNGRSFLAALIALDPAFADELRSEGVEARDYLESELLSRAHRLAHNRRVQRFALLDAPLTVEAGELTPTLKPRRSIIESKHRRLIEALYQERDVSTDPASESNSDAHPPTVPVMTGGARRQVVAS